jgi:hypothetical protein
VSGDEVERMMRLFRKPQGVLMVATPSVGAFNVGLCAILNAGLRHRGHSPNVALVAEYVPYRFDHTTMFLGAHADRRQLRATISRLVAQVFDTLVLGGHDPATVTSEAFRAAERDRLVIAVLGGRDALGCVERSLASDVDSWVVSQYLIGVIFVDLMLRNCPRCGVEYAPDKRALSSLGLARSAGQTFRRGKGCDACDRTGYQGFVCVPQVLEVDKKLTGKIAASTSPSEFRRRAARSALKSLKSLAVAKALQGLMPLEDVWLRFVKQRHCDH